jgi:Flp pilus assembly protein TadG
MNRNGQATVEFACVAFALLWIFCAIIDLSAMFFVHMTMQHAVREGARSAVVGTDTCPDGGVKRRENLTQKIKDSSSGFYRDENIVGDGPTVSVLTATSSKFTNYTTNLVSDTGQPDDIIVVSLTYSWPLITPVLNPIFPDRKYKFTVRATMKNEPWGQKCGPA